MQVMHLRKATIMLHEAQYFTQLLAQNRDVLENTREQLREVVHTLREDGIDRRCLDVECSLALRTERVLLAATLIARSLPYQTAERHLHQPEPLPQAIELGRVRIPLGAL